MKKFAQILRGELHWKFEQLEAPDFSEEIYIVEITGITPEPQEGWSWDGLAFKPPIVLDSELAKFARLKRDSLLIQSDWTQLRDIPEETRNAFLEHRKLLREITSQPNFPREIDWPAIPK